MITVSLNDKKFMKDMVNVVNYSVGFLDGINRGKNIFLNNLGSGVIEILKQYIDSNARMNPQALHHVYEWYQTGSPSARLFEIDYTVSNLGLSLKSNFTQSRSIKNGSSVPFYNKANIMENGIAVRVKPKNSNVLVFEDNGQTIFSKSESVINNPGGNAVQGSYERIFDSFFKNYFSQAFLKSSGLLDYLSNPQVYKNNLKSGKLYGRSKGITTGYRWITNARIGN